MQDPHLHAMARVQIQPPRQSFLQTANVAFVHLDSADQSVAPWPHHGTSQLMQPSPGCLVALQPKHPLQP